MKKDFCEETLDSMVYIGYFLLIIFGSWYLYASFSLLYPLFQDLPLESSLIASFFGGLVIFTVWLVFSIFILQCANTALNIIITPCILLISAMWVGLKRLIARTAL